MRIKASCAMSTSVTSRYEDELEIDDADLEGKNDVERERAIYSVVREWALELFEYWWEAQP